VHRRVQVLFALAGVAEAVVLPFLPVLLHERGLSAAEVGVALALAAAAAFVTTPLWGYAADRGLGAERTLAAASILAAIAAIPLAFAHGFWALTLTSMLVTGARCATPSLADSIALDTLGTDRAQYGRVRLWTSVGWAVACCVWGGLLAAGSLEWLPAIYGVAAVALAAWAFRLRRPHASHGRSRLRARGVLSRDLAVFLGSLLLVFAAYSATFSFVAIRMDELGGGLFIIGVAAGLQAVAETPVMYGTPRLGRAVGHRALYAAGGLAFAAAFVAWALIDSPVGMALVKLVAGTGFALAYVGSVFIVDDLVPAALRGTGQGLARAVCFGLAPILGSLAGGLVYGYGGPPALFLTCAGAAALGGVAAVLVAPAARAEPAQAPV
jgi:MFS transporter, PPP family, 3-phenylpropionic acid transporter